MEPASTTPLSEIVAGIESRTKTLRVDESTRADVLPAIEAFFERHDVEVVVEAAPAGRDGAAVLEMEGAVLAESDVDDLAEYVRATEGVLTAGLSVEPPAVVRRLDDNVFESYDKRQMIMGSRIPETRAWNVGAGAVYAGFQRLPKVDHQRAVYRNLGEKGLEVHVYGAGRGWDPDGLDVRAHDLASDEVLEHWWVAYDGDGDPEQKAVLLARERAPDQFYGFWTYEPPVVDAVIDRVTALA